MINNFENRNKNRNRYYGKRIGDIVIPYFMKSCEHNECEVVGYGGSDNNSIYIRNTFGDVIKVTAEECEIVKKIEEINK